LAVHTARLEGLEKKLTQKEGEEIMKVSQSHYKQNERKEEENEGRRKKERKGRR